MKNKLLLFFCLSMLSVGYGQGTKNQQPLKERLRHKPENTNLSKYLNDKKWNELFPHRYGMDKKDSTSRAFDFYSLKAFFTAAHLFEAFIEEPDTNIQKRELAAFLANISLETADIWSEKEGGFLKRGLYYLEEQGAGHHDHYADKTNTVYPPVPGNYYYGRGPVQLSWNYNYGQFSEAWFGNKDTLLQHPELLAQDPVMAFASAFWFWMTPQYPKPSCHDIMTGKWTPTPDDIAKGRLPGFGATVNVFNGGIECGRGTVLENTGYRYQYYLYYCKYFNVEPGDNIKCSDQKPFGQ